MMPAMQVFVSQDITGGGGNLKVIYVAGPYRAPNEYLTRINIRNAETEALWVWYNGGVAICPHKNTAGFGGAQDMQDEVWLRGDLELIRRCDALYAIGDYKKSEGSLAEIDLAHRLGLPILTGRLEVLKYLTGYVGLPTQNEWNREYLGEFPSV